MKNKTIEQTTRLNKLYKQLLLKMLSTIIIYTALGVMGYMIVSNLVRAITELQQIVNWVEVNRALLAVVYIIIGYCLIFLYYWKKPFQFLFELADATENIYQHSDGMIELSPELKVIESRMNKVKISVQKNERAVIEAEQRKNDLIAYLAHDLKTPLTSVIGYLSLLDQAADMPIEQRGKYVHITFDKALQLEKLINEFFKITRYNINQIVLEKENIDFCFMLEQMTDEFYPLLTANGNTVQFQVDDDISIHGDPVELARVFNNILKNAIAYSYPNTEILIDVTTTDRDIKVAFLNHGKTIPKQELNAIFDKFYRLNEARTASTGNGLGLAIAKEIVLAHGGTIWAESENEMTAFYVLLPTA